MSISDNVSRRDFLKSALSVSVFASLNGGVLLGRDTIGLRSENGTITGVVAIDLDQYPALNEVMGSVRLEFPNLPIFDQCTFGVGGDAFGRVMLSRVGPTEFSAVSARCTHNSCCIDDFNKDTERFRCQCHGSEFSISGDVMRGPASAPLTSYDTTFDGDRSVSIDIPGLPTAVMSESTSLTMLGQSTPNPVRDEARIEYTLHRGGQVNLAIFNLRGELIRSLVQSYQTPGVYAVRTDCSSLAAGIYVYRLSTSFGYSASRRMTVGAG